MTGLLQRNPAKRLGANGGEEIKRHPFFAKYIDWNLWVALCVVVETNEVKHYAQAPTKKDSAALQTKRGKPSS